MQSRKLGQFNVNPVGLGCMSLSFAYGAPPEHEQAKALLHKALDLGYDHLDTASLYGNGHNEELVGEALKGRRDSFILASKCGISSLPDGKRVVDGRPEAIRATCEKSLQRLQTDYIDLYYLHRRDFEVPIEDSVGALTQLKEEGKIRSIGLSEVSADTLRRAHAVHPIAAVQSEYSLCSRNVELRLLAACKSLAVSFVAFSPVGRSLLTGCVRDTSLLDAHDMRLNLPRFQGDNFASNLALLDGFAVLATQVDCSMAQLSLAWVLAQGDDIITIPGTGNVDHLRDNFEAGDIELSRDQLTLMDELINEQTIRGQRYSRAMAQSIDTEGF